MAAGSGIRDGRMAIALVVLSGSFLYLSLFTFRGWVPHDEGLLGQTAERVRRGEMPHIDFDDPYTGLLGFIHAGAFEMFGERLSSIRILMLLVAGLALPLCWDLASTIGGPVTAAFVTALMVVWMLPNYFAGVPSWFNLLLAIAGTAALVRHSRSGRRWWLVAAGVAGGLSLLIKISGLYFVAAALVWLALAEAAPPAGRRSRYIIAMLVIGTAAAFLFAVLRLRLSIDVAIYFAAPPLLLCALLFRRPIAAPRVFLMRIAAFGAGLAVPVAIFAAPYISRGALDTLLDGVFVLPQQRMTFASWPLPPLWGLACALPILAIVLWPPKSRAALVAIALVCIGLLAAGGWPPVYRLVWWTLSALTIILAITAAWRIGGRGSHVKPYALLFALVAVWCSLVQFPYPRGIYFCYVAPLIFLALAQLEARPAVALVGAFYLAFAALWLNRSDVTSTGFQFRKREATSLLLSERANLLVSEAHKDGYERIVRLIQENSGDSAYIYAAPDCPEIYFLSAKLNPTPTLYDFVRPSLRSADELRQMVAHRAIRVAVVNIRPEFSPPLGRETWAYLVREFPNGEQIGPFIVLWKNRTR